MDWITVISLATPILTTVLGVQLFRILTAFQQLGKGVSSIAERAGALESDIQERRQLWNEEMIHIRNEFETLRREHNEIMKYIERIVEAQERDSGIIGGAIKDLQKEHSDHTALNAEMKQLLQIIERRTEKQ